METGNIIPKGGIHLTAPTTVSRDIQFRKSNEFKARGRQMDTPPIPKELRDRVNKAWDHWSKLMTEEDMNAAPVSLLYVALEPKLTQAEVEYGRSLVLTEDGIVVRRCNRHIDCDRADVAGRNTVGGVKHCSDPKCEDCFGAAGDFED